ncbi:hypothetical protein GN244_ATG17225 [Phytophthora infestans]|uniref:Uncharacterized protein n=1 Tax=Phytophthora infestans TaxID=4787 RepID=A0A833SAN3_PHYIN|nr:hypothetical protein GN244_ATG17225 [Phytophthora infestans]
MYSIAANYSDGICSASTVYQVHAVQVANCTAQSCSNGDGSSASRSGDVTSAECSTDYVANMANMLSSFSYVVVLRFEDSNCSTLYYGYGTTELGECVENKYQRGYSISTLDANNSASIEYFADSSCSLAYASETATNAAVINQECSSNNYVWYTGRTQEVVSSSSSDINTSSWSSSHSEDGGKYAPIPDTPTADTLRLQKSPPAVTLVLLPSLVLSSAA